MIKKIRPYFITTIQILNDVIININLHMIEIIELCYVANIYYLFIKILWYNIMQTQNWNDL